MSPERIAWKNQTQSQTQSQSELKPSRRSAPKTRTGCQTCKKRKVKCDEGKPTCKRCQAVGMICDGYKSKSTAQKSSQKTLLPRISPPNQPYSTPPSEPSPIRNDAKSKDVWKFQQKRASKQAGIFRAATGLKLCHRLQSQKRTLERDSSSRTRGQEGIESTGYRIRSSVSSQFSRSPHQTRLAQTSSPIPCKHDPTRGSTSVTLFRQPSTSIFDNEDEHRYFRFFSDKTVAHIAGYYNPLLWNQSVLQACEGERSILDAAIAIGALDLFFKTSRSPLSSDPTLQRAHYRFSLQQMNKAIKQMRETVQKKQDLRTTLLASILIIAFEIYHGNHESALDQIRSSVQLLEDWTAPYSCSLNNAAVSPYPHTVEDDLVHAFYRLEIEGIAYIDKVPTSSHLSRKDDRAAAIRNMPSCFEKISEAQIWGKMIMRRAIHFLCVAWTYDIHTIKEPDKSLYIFDKIRCAPSPQSLAEREKYGEELARWYAAFSPLLERCTSTDSQHSRDRYSALCLQVHYLCVLISMDCVFRQSEMWFDTVNPIFTQILSMTKMQLDHPDDSFFVFDSQVIIPLDIVARKCRDPEVRWEAIRLMFLVQRREGFMDSTVNAKVCAWLAEIEEEGMVGDFVPEEARVRNVRMEPGQEKETLHVWCELPKKGGEFGEVNIRDTIIK